MSNTIEMYPNDDPNTWLTSVKPVYERIAKALERIADALENKVVINAGHSVVLNDESPRCICDEMRSGGVTYWDCPKCGHIERGFEIIPGSE